MQRIVPTIAKAGLIAGTLDIIAAFTYVSLSSGRNPLIVLNYIASAAIGPEAFTGGLPMQLLGLLFHYLIAFSFTVLFFTLYPKLSLLRKSIALTSIIYGLFVWCVMNLVVVPFSRIPSRPFDWTNATINMAILIVCIGLPLALMARLHFRKVHSTSPV